MATTWVPMAFTNRAWIATARGIAPDEELDVVLRRLGVALAHDNLKGVYAWFARICSVPFFRSQRAGLWGTYHRRGRAEVHKGQKEAEDVSFSVVDYPDLPEGFRTAMCGFCGGMVEACNGKFEPFTCEQEGGGWHFYSRRR